jgi:hypothetical protein
MSVRRRIRRNNQRTRCQVRLQSGLCNKPVAEQRTKVRGFQIPMCEEHSKMFAGVGG